MLSLGSLMGGSHTHTRTRTRTHTHTHTHCSTSADVMMNIISIRIVIHYYYCHLSSIGALAEGVHPSCFGFKAMFVLTRMSRFYNFCWFIAGLSPRG